jgi:hypothetical protein
LKDCAGGVHDQLCQKKPVETKRRSTRVDYPGNVGENDSSTSLDTDSSGFRPFVLNRGPVAQLGARFHGMEEVVGSIPTRSTKYLNNLAELLPSIWQQIQFAVRQTMTVISLSPF